MSFYHFLTRLTAATTCVIPAALALAQTAPPEDIVRTGKDESDRMTVPVRIEDSGPYRFVVDTGSQKSVVSRSIARDLTLAPGRMARIIAMGGAEDVDTALVGAMILGRRTIGDLTVAVLDGRHIGADGIVGLDGLQGQRVLLDFTRKIMAIGDARSLGGNSGFEIVVTARRRVGQLIMTGAVVDGVHTDVVIDTGSDTSMGNRALQKALRHRSGDPQIVLISVTGQKLSADIGVARRLEIGGIAITNLVVAYAESPVFSFLQLERRPAMMLGMRELRLFKRVAIDFARSRIYFDIPPTGLAFP